ncbi:MAG: UDP-3-O-(3-hydroxymyristoyl)glucosamine N-acyltransferase [Bacteroidales bacterium]|nr:UDP-3-O-(3-hydroxymyristoyl)glucosamine N-acyltransferase [Bacteroidales bacterium]
MNFTAQEIANITHGEVDGDPNVSVDNLSRIEEGIPGTLSFLANPKYTQYIYTTKASIVLVNKDFRPDHEIRATLVRVEDAYVAFATLLEYYNKISKARSGISSLAFISETAIIGKNVYIGEWAYIGKDVRIGDNTLVYPQVYIGDHTVVGGDTILYPGVRIYSENRIGNRCTLHSGAVIGSDGFGFAPQSDQHYVKVAQIGNVIIEDDVEIGANTTIDRATLGSTIIRRGAKLDNLIQVAHNVEIGENTVIAAQTGISGSSKLGRNCMIGGQVGIIGHLSIADDVKIAAQSGIGGTIRTKASVVQGSPAFDVARYRRSYIHFKNLPDLFRRLEQLENKLQELERRS